jgi:hypothetical protein
MRGFRKPFLLLSIIATVLILIIYIPPLIDFSVYNPSWNGYSDLVSLLNVSILDEPLTSLDRYSPDEYCLLIIPYKEYSSGELYSLSRFIDGGGIVLLLSDYGYANDILEYLDAPVYIDDSGILIDPLFKYRVGRMPIIRDFYGELLESNISSIYMNYASIIMILDDRASPLADSSFFSYYDLNLNNIFDEGEPTGPFTVAAKFRFGDGLVYVFSDPSFLLNSMVGLGDNLRVVEELCGGRKILLDQFHLRRNIHSLFREYVFKVYSFLGGDYIFPFFSISLIILISYLILSKISFKGGSYG